jgi:hypothetical protein
MRKLMIIISVILISGFIFAQTEKAKYGDEITLAEKTNISQILADPEIVS